MTFEDREPRFRVDIQVDCTTRDFFVANRMTNISRGGFFIEADLPLHSEIDLCFRLPGEKAAIGAKGRVIWTYDIRKNSARIVSGSGIKFTEMAHEHRLLLESYLRSLGAGTPAHRERAEAV